MIYSTQHHKNTNEDPKTSVVFENLMLLPDNIFWNILRTATENKNILPETVGLMDGGFEFWPKWNSKSKYDTGNSNYVEPDVFFRFEEIDVIVEAKYSDNSGQYREEWEREFKAYLNEYEGDGKKVVLLAVGGNSTFEKEEDIKVDKYRCPIVKYSWVSILNAALMLEDAPIENIDAATVSSIKRIVKNIEQGCYNLGIHKYKKKVEISGLSNLFVLGKAFKVAISRETDSYTLKAYREDINSYHYGYQFEVCPKDGRRKSIWLSIAFWINEQEVVSIEARPADNWAGLLCKKIEKEKIPFKSKYAKKPYLEEGYCYFDASEKFYDEFKSAETFDAQVAIISKMIDDVCIYYLS